MKKLSILLFCMLLLNCVPEATASLLQRVSKAEDRDSVQTFFTFDSLPRHEKKLSGKRLDLIFHNTDLQLDAPIFKQDDKIIKILSEPFKDSTVISFFFRYPPQEVTITPVRENTLVVDILLGNRFTRNYQELSSRLQGMTVLERPSENPANPVLVSPFSHDWQSFFSTYESSVTITAPVHIHIPSFPLIRLLPHAEANAPAANNSLLSDEIKQLAVKELWDEILPLLEQQIKTVSAVEPMKLLALTYGEALLRLGNFEGAYKQLYLLQEAYPKEQVGLLADYLLSLLLATNGDPYSADYRLREMAGRIAPSHPLAPYHLLSQAETSLATNQLEQMKEILARDDIAFPEEIQHLRELRQADLMFASGKSIRAYVTYQLAAEVVDLGKQPYSLNGLCETLYTQKVFPESARCYRNLTTLLTDPEQLGMTHYRENMARLKFSKDQDQLLSDFRKIEETFPGTEAGFRAALKKTDLRYLKSREWADTALTYYKALADKSIYRPVSEEGYFKEALLHHFAGDDSTSISRLMTLLRNVRSGSVQPHAEALLIQMLPAELRRLIEAQDYAKALALAKQNRRYFDNNWIDISLLADLAYSYQQLGIYDEALRLYLYLVEVVNVGEREQYYLPLTRIAYTKGDHHLVEDYASRYAYLYPQGKYRQDILLLRLNSLFAGGRLDSALRLLPEPLPEKDEFKLLAATLLFATNAHGKVVDILLPLWQSGQDMQDKQLFILAESLFQLGRHEEAEPLFSKVSQSQRFGGQALFRRAEIARAGGNPGQALKFLSEVTEKPDSSLWKKLAEQAIQLDRLSKSL